MQPYISNWSASGVVSRSAWSQPFAELLRRHRHAAGLTQEELAERACLSVRAVSDLERGVRRAPRRETIQLLADGLGLADAARDAFITRALFTIKRARNREPLSTSALPSPPALLRAGLRAGDAPSSPSAQMPPATSRQRLPIGRFLGALPEGTLFGREPEMARLRQMVEAAKGGVGSLVLLAGESGIGKTRLAQEMLREAYEGGFLIAPGRCYEQHKGITYFPFLEALTIAHAAATLALRNDFDLRWPEIANLLPDRDGDLAGAPWPVADSNRRIHLYWQVKDFLQALSQDRPLALMVDDLQWADESSLDLLLHLARHTRDQPIMLVGAYRDTDMQRQHPLCRALIDLAREQLCVRVDLRPLAEEATRRLICETIQGPHLSGDAIHVLHTRAGGIPFFALEVARAVEEQRDAEGAAAADPLWAQRTIAELAVPGSVRTIIEQRLDHLTVEACDVLREASILGESFTYAALRNLTDKDEETLDSALDVAVASGFIQEASDERFRFHYGLIQQTLHTSLAADKKRALHLRASEALEHGPCP